MSSEAQIETTLRAETRFRHCRHVAECTSTQDLAAADPAAGDGVYWADHQTKGRGRQQREWHDEPGADLAVTFRVTLELPQPLALPAALPIVVLESIEAEVACQLRVKWPNDLFLDGRKVAGVLIDAGVAGRHTYSIGVGVNCNRTRFPPDLANIATSLALATGRTVNRASLLLEMACRLDRMLHDLAARRHQRLEDVFRNRLGLLGQAVVVDVGAEHRGVLQSVDFQQLTLDGSRSFPLAIVRGIRRPLATG